MAVNKDGFLNGKMGNMVTYMLNGTQVTRKIGLNTKEPSIAQLEVRQRTRVVNNFLKQVADFTGVGFDLSARNANKKAYALAFGCNWESGLKGTYPDVQVDFEHFRLSEGRLPVANDVELVVEQEGFRYNWAADVTLKGTHWSDRVMMLAYFPKLKKAFYCTAGANRLTGTDLLPVHYKKKALVAETYLAFVSNDRKKISNSIYTGQLIW